MGNNYSIDDLYKVAGADLTQKVLDLFEGNEASSIRWFYNPNRALGYKTPYSVCQEGNPGEVERIIHRLEHGVLL
jgi:uncharacterized protein (DUF2384 family)